MLQMHVDEEGQHQLSNFKGILHNKKVTESDHAKVELKLDIQFPQIKPVRSEAYNFKSENCQKYFQNITTNTRRFTICFESFEGFPVQISKWEKNLKSCIVQCFPKIRSKNESFVRLKLEAY